MTINLKIFAIILVLILSEKSCDFDNSTKKTNSKSCIENDKTEQSNKLNCKYLNHTDYYKHLVNYSENEKPIIIDFNNTNGVIDGVIFNENTSQSYNFNGSFETLNSFTAEVYNFIGENIENVNGEFINDSTIKIGFNKIAGETYKNLIFTEDYSHSIKFEKYLNKTTYKLFGIDSTRFCEINIAFLNPLSSDILKDISEIQNIIKSSFQCYNNTVNEPCTIIDSLTSCYLQEYKKLESEEIIEDAEYYYNWEYDLGIEILMNDKNILSYCTYNYNYTGGAHGSSSELFENIDLKKCKKIELKDIFAPGYKSKLKENILSGITKCFGVKTLEELNQFIFDYTSVEITDNFYLNNSGIGFVYNEYEIAPYCSGTINVFIEYSELKNLLKKDFIKKMEIN